MSGSRILFVNIGWMEKYAGLSKKDRLTGGHSYLKKHGFGHEPWNFAPLRGNVYGYVPRAPKIRLQNLGASTRDSMLNDVTVVWIARRPGSRQTYIIGWYKHATVYREYFLKRRAQDFNVECQIQARAQDATLLPVDRRLFHIPTMKKKGNLGQSSLWYGGTSRFRRKVIEYVGRGGRFAQAKGSVKSPRNSDPAARKRIELAAVKHATRYYRSIEGGEHDVEDVGYRCLGWDLNVFPPTTNEKSLKVEVKGLSGPKPIVELTPHEYETMCSPEHREQYVIYIVTQAGTARERSYIFRYRGIRRRKPRWLDDELNLLRIENRTGARLSLK
jgi:hypothetical protein